VPVKRSSDGAPAAEASGLVTADVAQLGPLVVTMPAASAHRDVTARTTATYEQRLQALRLGEEVELLGLLKAGTTHATLRLFGEQVLVRDLESIVASLLIVAHDSGGRLVDRLRALHAALAPSAGQEPATPKRLSAAELDASANLYRRSARALPGICVPRELPEERNEAVARLVDLEHELIERGHGPSYQGPEPLYWIARALELDLALDLPGADSAMDHDRARQVRAGGAS
jgi:hypothetical protein